MPSVIELAKKVALFKKKDPKTKTIVVRSGETLIIRACKGAEVTVFHERDVDCSSEEGVLDGLQ